MDYNELKTMKMTDLKPAEYNPRKISDTALAGLKESIRRFGLTQPIVFNRRTKRVVSGHQRLKALKELGEKKVPVIVVDWPELTEKEANITFNNRAIEGEFTDDIVEMLKMIEEKDKEAFEALLLNEIPLIFKSEFESSDKDDVVPDVPKKPKTKLGDMYELGDHRLMCGDSTSSADVSTMMNGDVADAVFTSPPYNVGVRYDSHDDNMGDAEYMDLINGVMIQCFSVMGEGRMIAWNVGVSPKSKPYAHAAKLDAAGFSFYRHIVWKKTSANIPLWQHSVNKPHARYYLPNYNHEMIYLATKGPVKIGSRTVMPDELSMDVWDISQFSAGGHNHPAAFPVNLAKLAISVMTAENEIVFEPFGGSGSTLIASEKIGRRCYAMEIDPGYCDVIVQRWEEFTGKKAKLT